MYHWEWCTYTTDTAILENSYWGKNTQDWNNNNNGVNNILKLIIRIYLYNNLYNHYKSIKANFARIFEGGCFLLSLLASI